MQSSSVYPNSTRDEDHFPCIGSIAISHSTSYTKSCLTSFTKLQRFPETPVSSLEEHHFPCSNSRKTPCITYRLEMRANSLSLTEEVSQLSKSTSEEFSYSNRYVRGTLCFLPQVERTPTCPDSKEGRISLQWPKCRLVFHLTK